MGDPIGREMGDPIGRETCDPIGRDMDDPIDPDDEQYQKNLRRPAEVKEDIKQMSDRSRVSLILNSEAFRRELEEIVDEQLRQGNAPATPPVIPVADIKGTEAMGYTKQEKALRCKLAACYRLARVSQDTEHFLINPFGMNYSEITASSLVKIDIRGEVIDPGTTTLGVNQAGFTLHSAIHQFRPDIKCIIHLHTPAVVAVSGMKCGFLPLSQEALICGEISYHEYNGILIDQSEREHLQRNLGPINKIKEKTFAMANQGGGGVDSSGKKWKIGAMEFEAQMRILDNSGYRTGYSYKQPNIRRDVRRDKSNAEVEVPPSSSSFTYVFDGDVEHSKYMSPIKAAMERQKQQHKVGWLNSPNVYVKKEEEETGTQNPKKYTKWVKDEVEDGSPKRSTAIKVDHPNQFAPQGSDPREFKQKQKMIRKDYYEERVSAGPSSKYLEGLSWEEAEKLKQMEQSGGHDGSLSATGDSVIVIGAASKGIIQRDQQHNVQVYKSQYAANPFEQMSEEEIERYKWEVEHRGQGELPPVQEENLEPGPDGKLISTEERLQQVQQLRADDSQPAVDVSEDAPVEPIVITETQTPVASSREATGSISSSSSVPASPGGAAVIDELKAKNFDRSKSERKGKSKKEKAVNGDDEQMRSPAKSDTLRSTDSASGGETLEESGRSSKEGSPTKEHPSPTKEKKKKKKFRMPSFSKTKKNKESKENFKLLKHFFLCFKQESFAFIVKKSKCLLLFESNNARILDYAQRKHVSLKEIYCKMQGIIILLKDENRVNIYFLKERVFDVFFTKIF
ncbi:ADDA-like protein [Mya arenaria]|uniref:ADDA-like protein n=1 Tax=Mya arenaria TaxID=6604 RepID=A0ABY7FKS3_MYAAR|nr:ADDA-like protein [Mya arenaria]